MRPVDQYGVRHRPGCTGPSWSEVPDSAAMDGWRLMVCGGCGTHRLARTTHTTEKETTR